MQAASDGVLVLGHIPASRWPAITELLWPAQLQTNDRPFLGFDPGTLQLWIVGLVDDYESLLLSNALLLSIEFRDPFTSQVADADRPAGWRQYTIPTGRCDFDKLLAEVFRQETWRDRPSLL